LWQALWRQSQQPPPQGVPQAPQAALPVQPAQPPAGDINGPTPLPVAASGRMNVQPANQPGIQRNAPHTVPVAAPMMPQAGGNGTAPPAPVIDGPGAATPHNPAQVDSPPSLTNAPPPPPAFD
jgi:hypothetical protein